MAHRLELRSPGLGEIHLSGLLKLSNIKSMVLVATQDTEMLLLSFLLLLCVVSASAQDIYDSQMGRFFFFFLLFHIYSLRTLWHKKHMSNMENIHHIYGKFFNKLSVKPSFPPCLYPPIGTLLLKEWYVSKIMLCNKPWKTSFYCSCVSSQLGRSY